MKEYKNCVQKHNEELGEESKLNMEDHLIQFPWQPEQMPTDEELKKRREMRKEQGLKLKQMMQKKREEKKKKMEEELADLESLAALREHNELLGFKEEIKQRGFGSQEEYNKRVKFLQIKLNIKNEEQKTDEEKYNLID